MKHTTKQDRSVTTGLESLAKKLEDDFVKLQEQNDALIKRHNNDLAKLKEQNDALNKRHDDIAKRQQFLAQTNGGQHTKPSDIVSLNVSGTEMFARRDTLTIIKGSRLEALFSGRWENKLLRDERGRVFMDVDPVSFKHILECLYFAKVSAKDRPDNATIPDLNNLLAKDMDDDEKDMFEFYMDIFILNGMNDQNDSSHSSREGSNNKNNNDAETSHASHIQAQEAMATKLDEMEKKLEVEETFVASFVTDNRIPANNDDDDNDDDTASIHSTVSSHDYDDCDRKVPAANPTIAPSDDARGILNLFLNGEPPIAIKKSTLCLNPNSKLAQDFSDDVWRDEHKIVTEDGRSMYLVEHPGRVFTALTRQLQMRSVGGSEKPLPPIKSKMNCEFDKEYLKRMDEYYVLSNDGFDIGTNVMDGVILEDMNSLILGDY